MAGKLHAADAEFRRRVSHPVANPGIALVLLGKPQQGLLRELNNERTARLGLGCGLVTLFRLNRLALLTRHRRLSPSPVCSFPDRLRIR